MSFSFYFGSIQFVGYLGLIELCRVWVQSLGRVWVGSDPFFYLIFWFLVADYSLDLS